MRQGGTGGARRFWVVAAAGVLALGTGVASADAAPGDGYPDWTLGGSGGAYTASATGLATGFPTVSLASTSRATAQVFGGATSWLPASSSFGARFGSSQDREYLSLRPAADNARSPSTTTLTFGSPTPVGGWGVALGDVDAETLVVTGTDADGAALTGAELGLVPTFSACDASPRASACSGLTAPYAVPTATTGGTSVTLADPLCPSVGERCDTTGAAGWLSPTVPVRSLSITSTWKQGFPTYQLWLATAEQAASGSVTAPCTSDRDGVRVEALRPDDSVAASDTTGADGTWSLGGLLGTDDWRLRVVPSATAAVDDLATSVLDLSGGDVADRTTALRSLRPVSGTVVDATGDPLPGALVRVLDGTTELARDTTGTDGAWSLDALPVGDLSVAVDAPEGYTAPGPVGVTLGCDGLALDPVVLGAAPSPTPTPTGTATATPTATPTPTVTATATASAPASSTGSPTAGATTAPTTPPPAASGPVLAATGTDPTAPLVLGVALLAGGAALLALSRRRHHHRAH
ncbi:carboxypeptidase-like regulatory domain-containing protein [Arthrobacter sp. NEB 688]|uniref:carboxypeptidase-like regulatory domain-containing protein n=1 Tax=Arthrobacter sp. NEB 688 TaxID=904039 RepID=UPI001566D89A|nr:carboxypeptidase-like regulatory domain-containing protein [Arthrobacter sp. NEB 688]QKE83776.1 carboxypeptidase regulatory-like domain-containing protein [Arthrobacter sp. NEB 688]